MNSTDPKEQCKEINLSSKGIIAIPSGGDVKFKVGDKVKTRGDMGGFNLTVIEVHNNHYCTVRGYGKDRHMNMGYLEHR